MSRRCEQPNERGAALITVLFVFMIAALITMGMLARERLLIERTAGHLTQSQAYAYALGAEDLARQTLLVQARATPTLDHLGQRWARMNGDMLIESGSLALRIEDRQARFNLNSIIDSDLAKTRFVRLIQLLGLREGIAPLVIAALGGGTNARPMVDASELRAIEGITPEEIAQLLPYVVALPEQESALNVNTASDMLLKTYIADEAAYARFVGALRQKNFLTEAQLNGIGVTSKGMTTYSQHFRAVTTVAIAGRTFTLSSHMTRTRDVFGNAQLRITRRDTSGE